VAQKNAIKNNTMYFLSAVFIDNKKNTEARDKSHIVFDTEKRSAACFTSCNFIQLKYSQDKNGFKFNSIGSGVDPCPEATLGLEENLKSILPKITYYSCKGKDLVFMNNKDTLMIFYEKDITKK
jgi:heat shock protein HslJ